ncbi:M28 family metallopeptidase [Henriciella marina]|uniref:M28 family metallopeptidase n=1 Tax=Henriciella marina TaxID=453851 RepID=UPI000365C83E|nr:M28 family metallopeptidase [Henriciella marina]
MKRTFWPAISLLALAACSDPAATNEDTVDTAPADEAAATEDMDADASFESADLILPLPDNSSAEITAEDLAVRISTLADDAYEGRGPGSEAGENAALWIAREMERIGLEPGGDNGGWFQSVGMVEQTLDESVSGIRVNGLSSGEPMELTLKEDAVLWTKHQDETELAFDDSELVFVGYGVVAPEYDWNDYEGLDVDGKTVVMLVNDPGFARGTDDLFNGKAMTYYGRWTYKFEEAARQGATGAIIIHETEPASYPWEVVRNSWSGAQADLVRGDGGSSRTTFESWISRDVAETLFADAGMDLEEMKSAAMEPGFEPVDMGDLTVSGNIVQTVDTMESRNVIGMLPGTERPEEYVLYTAHWDHLGKKTEERTGAPTEDFYQDEIFNGAVDNATGSAALLDIAEAMAAGEHPRSGLFVSVTLEESGLLGSAYYADNPTVPLNQIVAGINMDGMLPVGRTKEMVVVGYGASELEDILEAKLEAQDRVVEPDPRPEAGSFYRSDHISFAKKGVPMLYADGGIDKRDGGVAAGRAAADTYTAQRYHKPMDEYSEDWNLEGMVEDVTALYEVGLEIINSDQWPTWYEGNEFEAAREASLAEADGE